MTQISYDAIYKRKFTKMTAEDILKRHKEEINKESSRFLQSNTQLISTLKQLPSFDEMYDPPSVDPDEAPPEPNTKEAGPACFNLGDCKKFSLMIMKLFSINSGALY